AARRRLLRERLASLRCDDDLARRRRDRAAAQSLNRCRVRAARPCKQNDENVSSSHIAQQSLAARTPPTSHPPPLRARSTVIVHHSHTQTAQAEALAARE